MGGVFVGFKVLNWNRVICSILRLLLPRAKYISKPLSGSRVSNGKSFEIFEVPNGIRVVGGPPAAPAEG